MRACWQLYVFLALPVAYLLIFSYTPILGVQIAFRNYVASRGIWGSDWVGLEHFKRFVLSFYFERTVLNTLRLSFYSLLTSFPLAITFALCINAIPNLRFKRIAQTITYIPHFISTVVLVGLLFQALSPVTGIYGNIYHLFGGVGYPADLLGKGSVFPHLYNWSGIWQNLGWSTIIYIAALSNVSPELHEAAEIDGANRIKRLIYIDFPTIMPTASIMLILSAGGIMSVGFEKVYLMQNDLNLQYSEVLSTYVYKVGMSGGGSNFSYSTAINLFNSLINCFMLLLVNFFARRFGEANLF